MSDAVVRRLVSSGTRNWGMSNAAPYTDPALIVAGLSRRQRQILTLLLKHGIEDGRVFMVQRATLRSSANFLQEMYFSGWLNGAGSGDARGSGNTPESSWWWLTERGEQIARLVSDAAS